MRKMILPVVLAVLLVFLLPVLLTGPDSGSGAGEPEAADTAAPAHTETRDGTVLLNVHTEEGDRQMTMEEYLFSALAGEMPANFAKEALKAQAVALRSYVLYGREHPKEAHPDADVCTVSGCCAAFADGETLRNLWEERYDEWEQKLRDAIRETDGEYLAWAESPALTVFHSSSFQRTETGADLGMAVPYLVSVSTPETDGKVTGLRSTVEVSAGELRNTVRNTFPEAVFAEGNPAAWVGAVTLGAAGRVSAVEIGGVPVTGLAVRQMFGLRSTDFTLAWDAERDCFVFRVNGYGHGLGMSQYGANLMASSGMDYREILLHYYPETSLEIF